jgi:hypothetical protein
VWLCYVIWRNYLHGKSILEDTLTALTVGLFGKNILQQVVTYTLQAAEYSVSKGTPYLHRRVMKTSTTVSSCLKAKVSECGVTSDIQFAFCVFKSHA